ncbi:MAG TPA: hypothetical protein VMZ91_10080 [Candidatus Paceibacterota bacterium]|nr:hypothetical protein [Candidatus Paceibacterota bacterium]
MSETIKSKILLRRKRLEEKQNWWKSEVNNRIKFGISKKIFNLAYGRFGIPFHSIKHKTDFESLESKFYEYRLNVELKTNSEHRKNIKHFANEFVKYKKYTFKQLEDSGGALKLSKTCSFVHIIIKNNIEYKEKKIIIYRRTKDFSESNYYPEKVKEIFINDRYCMAVCYLYKDCVIREVLFEKDYKKCNAESIEDIVQEYVD